MIELPDFLRSREYLNAVYKLSFSEEPRLLSLYNEKESRLFFLFFWLPLGLSNV